VTNQALNWLMSSLQRFLIPPDVHDDQLVSAAKPLAELTLLARNLVQHEGTWGRAGHRFLAHAWGQFQHGAIVQRLLSHRPDTLEIVAVYPCFVAGGLGDMDTEAAIRHALSRRSSHGFEGPVWLRLKISQTARELGMPEPWPLAKLADQTWLACLPEPWELTIPTAYSVTHTVLYLSDFGRRPHGLPSDQRNYLQQWLPAWLRYFDAVKNYDLLCEFIMTVDALALDIDTALWWESLAAVQDSDGSVIGPVRPPKSLQAGASPAISRFVRDYHTTIVAAFAGVLAAQRAAHRQKAGTSGS
jgi:hypothetical protein